MWQVKGFEPRTTRWKAWMLSLEQQKNVFASWMFLSSWQKQIFNWMQKSSCHSAVILCIFLRFIRFDLSSPKFLSTKIQKTRQQQKTYQNLKKVWADRDLEAKMIFQLFWKEAFMTRLERGHLPDLFIFRLRRKAIEFQKKMFPLDRSPTSF